MRKSRDREILSQIKFPYDKDIWIVANVYPVLEYIEEKDTWALFKI